MIDKKSPIPIYYQLEVEIKNLIETKQLSPGDLLPSEREYTEKYDISRMTVRHAIKNLEADGLIYRQKGKGTFVAEKKFEQDLSGLTSFSEDMISRGLEPSNKLLSLKLISHNKQIASILKTSSADPIYEIKRIRMANDVPVALETIYTPQKIIGELHNHDFPVSFYDYLEKQLQLKIAFGNQTIEAALANSEEIKHLNLNNDDPVLIMQRTTFMENNDETPIEYVKSTYRADKYTFKMQMKRA